MFVLGVNNCYGLFECQPEIKKLAATQFLTRKQKQMNTPNSPEDSVNPNELPIPKRYTEKETANMLNMAKCTLRRKRKDGLIGFHKDVGKIYYDSDQIKAYDDSTRIDPKSNT